MADIADQAWTKVPDSFCIDQIASAGMSLAIPSLRKATSASLVMRANATSEITERNPVHDHLLLETPGTTRLASQRVRCVCISRRSTFQGWLLRRRTPAILRAYQPCTGRVLRCPRTLRLDFRFFFLQPLLV